jgi:hypothetical protein
MQRARRWWLIAIVLVVAYVASYLILSRRGFAQTEALGGKGFYFFSPEDTATWRTCNYGCVVLFYPLIVADNLLGTGKPVANEPLWHLSR